MPRFGPREIHVRPCDIHRSFFPKSSASGDPFLVIGARPVLDRLVLPVRPAGEGDTIAALPELHNGVGERELAVAD